MDDPGSAFAAADGLHLAVGKKINPGTVELGAEDGPRLALLRMVAGFPHNRQDQRSVGYRLKSGAKRAGQIVVSETEKGSPQSQGLLTTALTP